MQTQESDISAGTLLLEGSVPRGWEIMCVATKIRAKISTGKEDIEVCPCDASRVMRRIFPKILEISIFARGLYAYMIGNENSKMKSNI